VNAPRPGAATPTEDRILDLVHGLLTKAEAARLLAEIEGDERAQEFLFESARALERARARGVPARQAPATARHRWPDLVTGVGRWWAFGACAAAAVAILVVTTSPGPSSYEPLPTAWEELHLRSSGSLDGAMRLGLEAYGRREWSAAGDLLAGATASGASDVLRRLYLASALAFSKRPADALEALEGVPLESVPEPWGSEGLWTRAIALEELGRAEEADAALRRLADLPGAAGERARERLRR